MTPDAPDGGGHRRALADVLARRIGAPPAPYNDCTEEERRKRLDDAKILIREALGGWDSSAVAQWRRP